RSFGANDWEVVWRVILPEAVPLIIAGLRVAVGPAMIGVILGELFGADRGLGFLIADHGRRLQTTGMFGALMLSTAFSLVVTTALMAAEARLSRWRTIGGTR